MNPHPSLRLGAVLLAVFSGTGAIGQTLVDETQRPAVLWQVDGGTRCDPPPTSGSEQAFEYDESRRWAATANTPGPLERGDPMVLTWSIVPDGTGGSGFTCFKATETAGAPSDLIAFLDGLHGVGPGGSDLSQRPWFPIFEAAFADWGTMTGIRYEYEPMDDGADAGQHGAAGEIGVRGDIRIGGHYVDGQVGRNTLACGYPPNAGGDIVLDTANSNVYGPDPPEHRAFRNIIGHEHGHGLALDHVCPDNGTKLMEPSSGEALLGVQEDDILAGNRGYGDRDEHPDPNDTPFEATDLGVIGYGDTVVRNQISIDGSTDVDFYGFTAPAHALATITAAPRGSTYPVGPEPAAPDDCSDTAPLDFNSLIQNNLEIELRGRSGFDPLASADAQPAGGEETIGTVELGEGAGTYFVRVAGAQDAVQMYDLTIEVAAAEADVSVAAAAIPDPAFVARPLSYEVRVENHGPYTAVDVATDQFPQSDLALVTTDGCAEDPDGVPVCTLGDLVPGERRSYTVSGLVSAPPGLIANSVGVTTTSVDPNPGNDTAPVLSKIVQGPSCIDDIVLTSDDIETRSGYGARNSISTGSDYWVGSDEAINFTAGVWIAFGNDTTIEGEIVAALDPAICPDPGPVPPGGGVEMLSDCTYSYDERYLPANGSIVRVIAHYDPTGPGRVRLDVDQPTTLVLVSYESTDWQVSEAFAGSIQHVYWESYDPSTVTAPAGVPVTRIPGLPFAFDWDEFEARALDQTLAAMGLTVDSFYGCAGDGNHYLIAPTPVPNTVELPPVCPPTPTPIVAPDLAALTANTCPGLAAEPVVCTTLSPDAAVASAPGSGEVCVTGPASVFSDSGSDLPSESVAWSGTGLYGCTGDDKLFRLDLVTGDYEEAYAYCDGVAAWDGGLVLQPPTRLGVDPMVWYPSFEHAACGVGAIETATQITNTRWSVTGDTVYSTWHSTHRVDRDDLVSGTELPAVLLQGFDDWNWGVAQLGGTIYLIEETADRSSRLLQRYDEATGAAIGAPIDLPPRSTSLNCFNP